MLIDKFRRRDTHFKHMNSFDPHMSVTEKVIPVDPEVHYFSSTNEYVLQCTFEKRFRSPELLLPRAEADARKSIMHDVYSDVFPYLWRIREAVYSGDRNAALSQLDGLVEELRG